MKNCVITTDYAFDATYIWVDFPFLTCHLPLEESSPPPSLLPVPYPSLTCPLLLHYGSKEKPKFSNIPKPILFWDSPYYQIKVTFVHEQIKFKHNNHYSSSIQSSKVFPNVIVFFMRSSNREVSQIK